MHHERGRTTSIRVRYREAGRARFVSRNKYMQIATNLGGNAGTHLYPAKIAATALGRGPALAAVGVTAVPAKTRPS
jgi:cystathionine beta-lyase/cystathionine gamma-synthase